MADQKHRHLCTIVRTKLAGKRIKACTKTPKLVGLSNLPCPWGVFRMDLGSPCLWGVLPMDMRTPALMSMGSTPHDIGDPMSMGKRWYWCHQASGISHQTGRQLTLSWVLAFVFHCLRAVGGERCDMAKTDTPARLHCKSCIDESSMRQESPFGSAQSPVESPQRVCTQSCL